MSTEQEAHRTANDPPGQGEPEGPNYIARSVAAKTAWLQRVLSPWAQRWLESGVEGAAPGEQHSQVALTVGNTQRLVGHVQRLVERGTVWRPEAVSLQPAMVDGFAGSIVNRFPDTGAKYELRRAETGPAQAADLVLAGTGEPTPPSAQPSGQTFQPFASLADFRKAIEAKQRSSEAGPAASEPPQASQPAQPQVQRTPVLRTPAEPPKARRLARTLPPGSRPVSRVEEVLPGVEAAPKGEATLQTQAGLQAPAVQRHAVETAPTPSEEEVSPPTEASSLSPAAGRTTPPAGLKMPAVQRQPEPGPAAALVEGTVPVPPPAGVEPPRLPASREATPPAVQRQIADTSPAPAQPPQAEGAPPAPAAPLAGLEMPVAQRRPEPGLPPASAGEPSTVDAGPPGPSPAPEKHPIQRRATEEAPAQAPTVAEAGPLAPPTVRRRVAEESAAQATKIAEAGPAARPAVQRQPAEEAPAQATDYAEPGPPAPPVSGGEAPPSKPDMPLVQRQAAEAAPSPVQPPRAQKAPPAVEAGSSSQPDLSHVQRQVADEAPAPAPAYAGQEPPARPSAGPDALPVQRKPVETPPFRKEAAPPVAHEHDNKMPLVQRKESEIESPATPVVEAAPPGHPEGPLVQRQPAGTTPPSMQPAGEEAAPPAPPAVEKTAPAGPEMPLAQRQPAEVTPISAQPPRQRQAETPSAAFEHENEMPLVQRQVAEIEPSVGPVSEAAPSRQGIEVEPPVAPVVGEAVPPRQGPKMPLVQRQPAGTGSAPAPLPHEEGALPEIEAELPGLPAGGETPPARPELPLVQRSLREEVSQAEAGPGQVQRASAPGEPTASLEGEVMARAASRAHLPLIEPTPPAQAEAIRTKPVPQARAQSRPEGSPEPPALAPSRPEAPASGSTAQAGWAQATAGELPLPPPLQRSVAPARPASTAWIQRQPETSTPSPVVTPRPEPWHERIVQRDGGEEPPSQPAATTGGEPPPQPTGGESAPPNLDSLARQIYPLIKRMLAVERERKWGR